MHENPSIDRTLRQFARAKLHGEQGSAELPSCITPPKTGDLVIHVPASGERGSGPWYVDRATHYDEDDRRTITVSLLVYGPTAWTRRIPYDEAVPVGHFYVNQAQRRGNAFSLEVLGEMEPVIEEGTDRFFKWFPTFVDGRTEVQLSAMHASKIRSAYITDDAADELVPGDWEFPGLVLDQTAYAAPSDGRRTFIEATARRGKFLVVFKRDGRRYAYFVNVQMG